MKRLAILLLATCSTSDDHACPVMTTTEQDAIATVQALCAEQQANCTAEQRIELAWARGTWIGYSPVRCAENIRFCRFAVWHEIGHAMLGDNEHLADCFAADNAKPADTDAAVCYFNTTTIVGGADATHGSGASRADRIRLCQN